MLIRTLCECSILVILFVVVAADKRLQLSSTYSVVGLELTVMHVHSLLCKNFSHLFMQLPFSVVLLFH